MPLFYCAGAERYWLIGSTAVATSAQRKQITGHADDSTFQSMTFPTARVNDFQAVFLQQPSRSDLIKCTGTLSRWRNSQAPVKITKDQKKAIGMIQKFEKHASCETRRRQKYGSSQLSCMKNPKTARSAERSSNPVKIITRYMQHRRCHAPED